MLYYMDFDEDHMPIDGYLSIWETSLKREHMYEVGKAIFSTDPDSDADGGRQNTQLREDELISDRELIDMVFTDWMGMEIALVLTDGDFL